MHICQHCGFKYMLPSYEGETHIFLRCPNPRCGQSASRRKQLTIRGSIVKPDGSKVEVNTYDGEITIIPTRYDLLKSAGFTDKFIKQIQASDEQLVAAGLIPELRSPLHATIFDLVKKK